MALSLAPDNWKDLFCAALAEVPVVQYACDAARIQRCTAYRNREADKEFRQAWDDAMEAGIDRAEREVYRRGVEGYYEPVIHQGRLQFVYERYTTEEDGEVKEHYRQVLDANGQPVPLTIRKHSDAMVAMWLKGRRKSVFADRTEITGADGGPLAVDETARRARMQAILNEAKARRSAEDFG